MYRLLTLALAFAVFALAAGCQQKAPHFDPSTMKAPPRPAELDRLDAFAGTWEGTYEMRMEGMEKPMTGTGTSIIAWEKEKWALVERMEGNMTDMGKMLGLAIWTWDANAKKYRMDWFDSWGMTGTGHATYDETTKTWHMVNQGTNPATGQKTVSEGTMRLLDNNNTMVWDATEYNNSRKSRKLMEMKGMMKRK